MYNLYIMQFFESSSFPPQPYGLEDQLPFPLKS